MVEYATETGLEERRAPELLSLDVQVEERHAREGLTCSSVGCVVALAILEAISRAGWRPTTQQAVFVTNRVANVHLSPWDSYSGVLPDRVQDLIRCYDDGTPLPPLPMVFGLDLKRL